jgi:hypothetical protein
VNDGRFKPGAPGRPKGAVSKITRELRATLEDNDFNAAEAMLFIYKRALQRAEEGGEQDVQFLKIAAEMAADLASYCFPKPKPIQTSLSEISDDEFMAEAQRRLDERNKQLAQGEPNVREERNLLTSDNAAVREPDE